MGALDGIRVLSLNHFLSGPAAAQFLGDLGADVIAVEPIGGAFQRNAQGLVVNAAGLPLLDTGGAPIFLPPDAGRPVIAADGTVSVDGQPLAQVAVMEAPEAGLTRLSGAAFRSASDPVPVENPQIRQGAIEGSNVDAVAEIARMIEVQRAYEQVQSLIDDEDRRVSDTIETLGARA